MTEDEWESTTNPAALLLHLQGLYQRGELGERKFIRFAVACCHRIWDQIADPRSQSGVTAADLYADKRFSLDEAQLLCEVSRLPVQEAHDRLARFEAASPAVGAEWAGLAAALHAAMAANETAACSHASDANNVAKRATYAVCCRECPNVLDPGLLTGLLALNQQPAAGKTRSAAVYPPGWEPIIRRECQALSGILRDVFGNPLRAVEFDLRSDAEAATGLARRMYDAGDFSAMPELADELAKAGCDVPEVISHCRGPGPHVRGCWVVDRLLGWDYRA